MRAGGQLNRHHPKIVRPFVSLIASIAWLGCTGAPAEEQPPAEATVATALVIVAGNDQLATIGEELPSAVVVRAVDATNHPVSGQIINFRVVEGGGSVFAGAAITDDGGTARERWTMGPTPGPNRLEARAVDPKSGAALVFAAFTADGVDHPPLALTYATNPARYTKGVPIEPNAPTSSGGAVVAFSVAPPLPEGLALDASTGIVSGTPTAPASGVHTVKASNSGGFVSADLAITVADNPPPTITEQPVDAIGLVGGEVAFSVAASGEGVLRYQWRRSGTAIEGATSPTLTLTDLKHGDAVRYAVVVTSAAGGLATSAEAKLTVRGFVATGAMSSPRENGLAVTLSDGRVLFAGGDTFRPTNTAELYLPGSGTFVATGNLVVGRIDAQATLLENGLVLVTGGRTRGASGLDYLASAELYDPATGAFRTTGAMLLGRSAHTSTLLANGKVLIAGGHTLSVNGDINPATPTAELYDPVTGTFSATGRMADSRAAPMAARMANGEVLVVAGEYYSGGYETRVTAERYDPAAGTFARTGELLATCAGWCRGGLLENGHVLVTGALSYAGRFGGVFVDVFDPATGLFARGGQFLYQRNQYGFSLLAGGRALAVGGRGMNGRPVVSSELYDPATGTSVESGNSLTPRLSCHTARLADGSVLVAGGYTTIDGGAVLTALAERWVEAVP